MYKQDDKNLRRVFTCPDQVRIGTYNFVVPGLSEPLL